ncbi:hypothetical protein BDW74DRAFT_189224 [Aspergillus multicolor]|uniref:alpha/beta hydrolase n=1 Tax=Aspergillus multicolor TaxID=41759 RepID=UPI003CCD5C76
MPLRYDPEFAAAAGPALSALHAAFKAPPKSDPYALRDVIAGMVAPLAALPKIPTVEVTTYQVPSAEGHSIAVYGIIPKQQPSTPGPAILHAHGSGFIQGSAKDWVKIYAPRVEATGVPIFTVDYRLAPEHPFPAAVNDVYTALTWLYEHAAEVGLDISRIAVMGESAGGGLAAGVALMARDKGLTPPLAKQILLYPVLEDRNVVTKAAFEPFLLWNWDNNATAFNAYLGDKAGKDDVSPYAAPARASSLEGVAPMYVDVGGLDIYLDECIAYGGRAASASVEVELHVYPGVPHGFEALGVGTSVINRVWANRDAAMKSF